MNVKLNLALSVSTVVCSLLVAPKAEAGVLVEVFSQYVDTGSSVMLSDSVGTFEAPSVDFVIGTGAAWHPFGLSSFGARITGNLTFPSSNTLRLGTTSSDGSYLFLNGDLLVQNGGEHNLVNVQSSDISVVADVANPFEIQFFNAPGDGPSGVDLGSYFQSGGFFTLGSSYFNSPVPEPGSLTVLGLGVLVLVRRRRN